MNIEQTNDGIHSLLPRELMSEPARKLRDAFAIKPGAPLYHKCFGFYSLEKWKREEGLPEDFNHFDTFMLDGDAFHCLGQLGWCEAPFVPCFETKVIKAVSDDEELVQDYAGRHVLFFKGRRNGFMPEYVDHPVKDMKTWEENVKWRLAIDAPGRFETLDQRMENARLAAARGDLVTQNIIGAYMYLRSLIGPEDLLYMFYDNPELIHDCMKTWFELNDAVITKHQQHVTIDQIFFGEDICYNGGSLISPDMMREFLFPYYAQLISNIRSRQIDQNRHVYIHIDTDGRATDVIDIYKEIGMNAMSPFEVASGCDVVEVGKQHPDLVLLGGIDKRILAQGKDAIDRELERILPPMIERGGYIPTCDHGVPEEVTLESYLHYRKRCIEYGGPVAN